jgi:hypothetical protein
MGGGGNSEQAAAAAAAQEQAAKGQLTRLHLVQHQPHHQIMVIIRGTPNHITFRRGNYG